MNNNLKTIRTNKNLSQAELAKMSKISRPYLSDIETGVSKPSVSVALRLSKSLNCSVEDIFFENDVVQDLL